MVPGCATSKVEPVDLQPEDVCARCKMAISEKQYAAELIDVEGQAFKFDDISCMADFIKSKRVSSVSAYFVMDFDARQWIKGEDAFFMRSTELKTPMNGGIIAFKDQERAEAASTTYHGTQLRFKEIVNP
ncbi:MAG TPA: nitrous oxide reductase accessory protein NosL [Pyrinomonadaceae bacterium]